MPQYVTFLFCLGESQQNAEVSKQSQAAATIEEEEVKTDNQTCTPMCGTGASTGMLIMYYIHYY
jgi:hypothetical protein